MFIKVWFTKPLRPSKGIQEIMRITLEVQKGTVHRTNNKVWVEEERTQNAKKYAMQKPKMSVTNQTTKLMRTVDQ